MMKLAHFSDIHTASAPHRDPLELLHPKRAIGALNYYFGGRWAHFWNVEQRIARLLEDIEEQKLDHALCTGDVTLNSSHEEFARCASVFGARRDDPVRWTVIPGNHDRYTKDAFVERRFERYFGQIASPQHEDVAIKRIATRVALVTIDVSVPSLVRSRGELGPTKLRRLEEVLTDRSLQDDYVILAMHYGLLRSNGGRDKPTHRLKEDLEVLALIDRPDVHLDLVLHGHIHGHYALPRAHATIICTGSATDLAYRCGYNVYDIDPEQRTFTTERRVWDRTLKRYGRASELHRLRKGLTTPPRTEDGRSA